MQKEQRKTHISQFFPGRALTTYFSSYYQKSNSIFQEIEEEILTFAWNLKISQIVKAILKKNKAESISIPLPNSKLLLQTLVTKTVLA